MRFRATIPMEGGWKAPPHGPGLPGAMEFISATFICIPVKRIEIQQPLRVSEGWGGIRIMILKVVMIIITTFDKLSTYIEIHRPVRVEPEPVFTGRPPGPGNADLFGELKFYRSFGVSPVFLAIRAIIRGPISSASWKEKT